MLLSRELLSQFSSFICLHCWPSYAVLLIAVSATPTMGAIKDLGDLTEILTQANANKSSTSPAALTSSSNVFYAEPGPWGKLRCSYIYLEAPKSLINNFPMPNTTPRWSFPGELEPQLAGFFRRASLSEALISVLLSEQLMVRENGIVHVFPPLPDLEALTPESRAIIYTELSKHPVNEFCAAPILIVGQSVQEWYRTSKLRPELISKIEQMCYKRGETTAFSDVSAILNYAESDSEARAIFKAFTRTRALLVKIELDRSTNVEELVNYWTLGSNIWRKDIEPFVQSIIDTDGAETSPLSHLLPPLVRKLMYTYPGLDLAKHGLLPDCHWTSLNFFNYEPHQYFSDSRLAARAVMENFDPVEPPYKYGDVLFFMNNVTGDAYHSCVYLADRIVFTKNGYNLLSPWLLMKLDDVEKIYLYQGDERIQGYRRKDPNRSISSAQ